ncbi:MAG: GCN5-related N-acetyltransferase [Frankiales bacterium]|nr:GCN5-related N-acetyltransferase [Frankiales bacterium]
MSGITSEILVALVVTGLLGASSWTIRVLQDRATSRRYPVAGVYASSYEDRVDGEIVTTKAVARITQRGRRLSGHTENLSDQRAWGLEARLTRDGRIYGTYRSADPYDEGTGGFFLERAARGRLEGMWAGYDSTNKSIESGRYSFWPLPECEVEPLEEAHVPAALSIVGEALGKRYIGREELESYARREEGKWAFVAKDRAGRVVGAATCMLLEPTAFLGSLPVDQAEAVARLMPGLDFERIGVLKSIAIAPAAEQQGLGTALTRRVMEQLWSAGATSIVTIGWTDAQGCHVEGLVRGLAFKPVGALSDFWCQDSVAKGYECPTCGSPCRCEARLFSLRHSDVVPAQGAPGGRP